MSDTTLTDIIKVFIKKPSLIKDILSDVISNEAIQKELGLTPENKERLRENLKLLTKESKL